MLACEIKKILGRKFVCVLAILLFIANLFLIYTREILDTDPTSADAKAYSEFHENMKGLSEEEKYVYVENAAAYLEAMLNVQIYANFGYGKEDEEFFAENYPELDLEECIESFLSGEYLKYTDNIFSERQLLNEVAQELEDCRTYGEYVDNVLGQTVKLLKRTENRESYRFRNLVKMYFAFNKIKDVQTEFGPSRGIRLICSNLVTDLLILIFIVIVAVLLVTEERERGLLILPKSTYKGRGRLGAVKFLALCIVCILTMLLHIENLVVAGVLYDFGNLGRSIQSVSGYSGCVLPISVGEYILLYFGLKLLVYLMFASLIYAICNIFSKSMWVYLVMAALIAGLLILYRGISNTSYLLGLKKLSPIGLLHVNDILGKYDSIRLGKYALPTPTISLAIILFVIVVCVAVGICMFALKKERSLSTGCISIKFLKRIFAVTEIHTNRFAHELYRTFITGKAIWILLLAGAFIRITFSPMTVYISQEESYYKSFTEEVLGPSENVPSEHWDKLMEYYSEVYSNALMQEELNTAQNAKYAMTAIERCAEHGRYLQSKKGSWYLYDGNYKVLTEGEKEYVLPEYASAAFVVVIGIFCFVGMYSNDYQNDGIRLLRTTRHGRWNLNRNKLMIGITVAAAITAMAWLPQLLFTIKGHRMAGLDAPAYSMEHMEWLPQHITIGWYLVLLYIVRFTGVLTFMLLTFAVTMRMKSFIISACVMLALTLLPIGLVVLGVDFMKYFLLTPILVGNTLFANGAPGILALCLMWEAAVLAFAVLTMKCKIKCS